MPTNKELLNYNKNLLATQKYNKELQFNLKKRVFVTFDNLLKKRGYTGLIEGKKLLDLGSADNAFVTVCNKNGLIARGLDINDNINFEKDKLPMKSNSIDIVTGISIIEHLYSPERFLSEIKRILKPNGFLILVMPNWRYSWRSYFDDPTHVRPYTETSIQKLLESFNFYNNYVVPYLVMKPTWMWNLPFKFFFAKWMIPFRGNIKYVPKILKGSSSSILTLSTNSK